MNSETCYMCDATATTKEHAPPKCIFPEKKDLVDQSIDFRKNLIKVPSCPAHNTDKSNDDEYLLNILSMNISSSKNGVQQFLTKVQRAWTRSGGLRSAFMSSAKPVLITTPLKFMPTFALTIDTNRIVSSLESCARALYYNKFQKKFLGSITIVTFFLRDLDPRFDTTLDTLYINTQALFKNIISEGDNPEIFSYKFFIEQGSNKVTLEMNFYEGSKAIALFI